MANLPYELTVSVHDLQEARRFYVDLLGAQEEGAGSTWSSVSFYGNRLTLQQRRAPPPAEESEQDTDGSSFGVVVLPEHFAELLERLEAARVDFIRKPSPAERPYLEFIDPNGHAVEIKAERRGERS